MITISGIDLRWDLVMRLFVCAVNLILSVSV